MAAMEDSSPSMYCEPELFVMKNRAPSSQEGRKEENRDDEALCFSPVLLFGICVCPGGPAMKLHISHLAAASAPSKVRGTSPCEARTAQSPSRE